jgi:hypothetical protein
MFLFRLGDLIVEVVGTAQRCHGSECTFKREGWPHEAHLISVNLKGHLSTLLSTQNPAHFGRDSYLAAFRDSADDLTQAASHYIAYIAL